MAYTDTKHVELSCKRIEFFPIYISVLAKLLASVVLISFAMPFVAFKTSVDQNSDETRPLLSCAIMLSQDLPAAMERELPR